MNIEPEMNATEEIFTIPFTSFQNQIRVYSTGGPNKTNPNMKISDT